MDYLLGTTGNKLQHPSGGGGQDAMRKLEYPIDLRADQDYYISYLAMGDYDALNNVFFNLLEGKSSASTLGVSMLREGYPNVTTPTAYLVADHGDWVTHPITGWTGGVVHMVVVKIEAKATEEDVVSVCVFSDPDNILPMEEPAVWQQSISASKDTVYPWLQFSGSADAYDMWHVDEIRVGTGWGAVTGWVEACGDLGTIMDWDLNEDCQVNLGDFGVLAGEWLDCTDPAGVGCENLTDYADLITDLDPSLLTVNEVGSAVTVDGDLSEWDGPWYNVRFASGYNPASAADITAAEASLKWDPTNPEVVYLALKVTDTAQTFTDAPAAWNDADNVEVRFSVNDTSTDTLWFNNQTYDIAQYYHVFNKASGGTWCTLGSVYHATDDPATDDIDVAYATSVVGDEIIYEMALPTYLDYTADPNNTGDFGTKVTLTDGDVVAFNLQINSGDGGLHDNQNYAPNNWFKFTVTANSSIALGDWGFIASDLDTNGEVGLSDLNTIAQKWLSCTDPEIAGCDTPWAP